MAPEDESKKAKSLSAVLRSKRPPHTAEVVISIPEYLTFTPQWSYSPRAGTDRSSDVGPVDDVFLEVIDISLGGQSEKCNGRTSKKGEGVDTLEAVLPVPESTIRIYCTHNVANNKLRSHLRNSGITEESLLDILGPRTKWTSPRRLPYYHSDLFAAPQKGNYERSYYLHILSARQIRRIRWW